MHDVHAVRLRPHQRLRLSRRGCQRPCLPQHGLPEMRRDRDDQRVLRGDLQKHGYVARPGPPAPNAAWALGACSCFVPSGSAKSLDASAQRGQSLRVSPTVTEPFTRPRCRNRISPGLLFAATQDGGQCFCSPGPPNPSVPDDASACNKPCTGAVLGQSQDHGGGQSGAGPRLRQLEQL